MTGVLAAVLRPANPVQLLFNVIPPVMARFRVYPAPTICVPLAASVSVESVRVILAPKVIGPRYV